ncbi:MAG: Holliday junction resolvase RecU [Anaeroplasma sp.]|nr:Holliday junction resolvase RecU [Anaeroplasma sp.]
MSLNFPIKRKERQTIVNKANLGMDFEALINESNTYYLNNDIAVIHKKPTPVQIVKVDYPQRAKAVITEAYYKTPSTTDYNGIYKGKYIDFEAKESHNKTAFPLANIHPHQIEHLKRIIAHGGIGFFIFYWQYYNKYYILDFNIVLKYWENSLNDGRKSIPYQEFLDNGYLIQEGYLPRLNYLKVIDEKYFK